MPMQAHVATAIATSAFVLVVGCDGSSESVGHPSVSESDSAGVLTVAIDGPVERLPEWQLSEEPLFAVGRDRPPLLAAVGEVGLQEGGRLLVSDRQASEVWLVGSDRRDAALVAGSGNGPGEVQDVRRIFVAPGDTTYLFDARTYRVSKLDPEGGFVSSTSVAADLAGPATLALDAWGLGASRFLVVSVRTGWAESPRDPPHRVERERLIRLVSDDGDRLAEPISFAGETNVAGTRGEVRSPFSNRPFVAVGAGRIVYGSGVKYELTVLDYSLQPTMVIRWSGWEAPVADTLLASVRRSIESSMGELRAADPESADWLLRAFFGPDVIPPTLPALGPILLDDSGRIWVSGFRLPRSFRSVMSGEDAGWGGEKTWHVLGLDGIPVARLRIPEESRLLAIRGGRAVVVARDSLGVQRVKVMAIIS